nr:TetR/AcrR family transcriptional regulator C-terminal domain-containing protein [Propionicimonas sp.]
MAKGISRESIIEAALAVLDEKGIEGLTVRALANRLGVQAPALYWHVENKRELLDEMGTEVSRRVAAAMDSAPPTEGWRDGLALFARVLRREYLVHRDGARTFAGVRITDPAVLRSQERWLVHWTASGLAPEKVARAAQLVTWFVIGFVIEEQERADPHGRRSLATKPDQDLAADLPLIARVGPGLFAQNDERFEFCLDTVLTGLEVRFDSETAP